MSMPSRHLCGFLVMGGESRHSREPGPIGPHPLMAVSSHSEGRPQPLIHPGRRSYRRPRRRGKADRPWQRPSPPHQKPRTREAGRRQREEVSERPGPGASALAFSPSGRPQPPPPARASLADNRGRRRGTPPAIAAPARQPSPARCREIRPPISSYRSTSCLQRGRRSAVPARRG